MVTWRFAVAETVALRWIFFSYLPAAIWLYVGMDLGLNVVFLLRTCSLSRFLVATATIPHTCVVG